MSDSTAKNKSGEIKDLEHHYNISGYHYSELGYQNWVENKIRDIKNMVNNIMDIMGTPAGCWLICTMYIIALMQLISQPSLGGISSMQKSDRIYSRYFQMLALSLVATGLLP